MEPASIRYKNPGAMWGGNAISKKWGEIGNIKLADGMGQNNHIAAFPTYVQGICAQIDLWRTPRYRNRRFDQAISVWSGGNWVSSYVKFVTDRVPGMTAGTIINDAFLNSPMGIRFLKAQAWHEAGKPYPAPDADWIRAQRLVFSGSPAKSFGKRAGGAVVATSAAAASHLTGDIMSFILGILVGGAAVWFGRSYIESAIAWVKAKVGA